MPECFDESVRDENRLAMGNVVGDLAMEYFGDFEEVPFSRNKEEMIATTQALMDKNVPIIAEASFSYDDNFCSVDILKKVEGGYELVEVKSSSFSPEDDLKKVDAFHLHDMSYQVYVLSNLRIPIKKASLMQLNKEYVREGELNLQELFLLTDCTTPVFKLLADVPERIQHIKEEAFQSEELKTGIGKHCFSPFRCGYQKHCFKHLPENNIFTVGWRLSNGKKEEYYQRGFVDFEEIDMGVQSGAIELNEKQIRQIQTMLHDLPPHIDQVTICKFLKKLRYPLYHLDFETFQQTIPEWDGVRPYQQIPFQYSIHIQEEPGGQVTHKEFLAEEGRDPRRVLAQQLCKDIPMTDEACVLAYWQSFEKGRIAELAQVFPDLREHLLWIHDNIMDLATPFHSGAYYHRDMAGSFSIKSVLPALFPDEPELDYNQLGLIKHGGDAMNTFPILHTKSPEEIKEYREALLAYCHLDTLAMVKVLEKLEEMVQES